MLHLKKVSKTFKDVSKDIQALKEIDLNIKKGEVLIVVGESGSGKSTLLNILGFIYSEYEGTYFFENLDSKQMTPSQKARYRNEIFGYVFQNFSLVEEDNVYENIEIPLLYSRKFKSREHKEKILALVKKFGIEHVLYKKVKYLSGGERQRVALARALVNEPDIVLMDEPTSALNEEMSEMIMNYVYQYIEENQKTLIIVTHDLNRVVKGAYRKIVLKNGEKIEESFCS